MPGVGAWRDVVTAQLALLKAGWRVRRAPLGELVARQPRTDDAQSGDALRARRLATAVMRVADYGVYRPYCLVRVLALQDVLRANGIHGSAVRVGVRRVNGVFTAHAWVVWRGEILGDRPDHVAQFVEVDDLRVLTNR